MSSLVSFLNCFEIDGNQCFLGDNQMLKSGTGDGPFSKIHRTYCLSNQQAFSLQKKVKGTSKETG